MYVRIHGRRYKVYEEDGEFYIIRMKRSKEFIDEDDVERNKVPTPKRRNLNKEISELLKKDAKLKEQIKKLKDKLKDKTSPSPSPRPGSPPSYPDLRQELDQCNAELQRARDNFIVSRGDDLNSLFQLINEWVREGFMERRTADELRRYIDSITKQTPLDTYNSKIKFLSEQIVEFVRHMGLNFRELNIGLEDHLNELNAFFDNMLEMGLIDEAYYSETKRREAGLDAFGAIRFIWKQIRDRGVHRELNDELRRLRSEYEQLKRQRDHDLDDVRVTERSILDRALQAEALVNDIETRNRALVEDLKRLQFVQLDNRRLDVRNEELQAQLDDAQRRVRLLEEQAGQFIATANDEMRARIFQEVRGEYDQLTSELRNQLEKCNVDLASCNLERDQFNTSVERFNLEKQRIQQEYELKLQQVQVGAEEQQLEWNRLRTDLQNQLLQLTLELDANKRLLGQYTEDNSGLSRDVSSLQTTIQALKDEFNLDIQKMRDEYNSSVGQLGLENASTLEALNQRHEERIQALRRDLLAECDARLNSEESRQQFASEIQQLNDRHQLELQELRQRYEEDKNLSQLNENENDVAHYAEIDRLRASHVEEMTNLTDKYAREIDTLQLELNRKCDDEKRQMQNVYDENDKFYNIERSQAVTQIQQLQETNQQLRDRNTSLSTENERLSFITQQLQKDLDSYISTAKYSTETKDKYIAEKDVLAKQLEDALEQVRVLQRENTRLQQSREQQNFEIDECIKKTQELEQEFAGIMEENAIREAQLRTTLNSLEQQNLELNRKIEFKQEKIDELTALADDAINNVETIERESKKEIDRLNEEIKSISEDYSQTLSTQSEKMKQLEKFLEEQRLKLYT